MATGQNGRRGQLVAWPVDSELPPERVGVSALHLRMGAETVQAEELRQWNVKMHSVQVRQLKWQA